MQIEHHHDWKPTASGLGEECVCGKSRTLTVGDLPPHPNAFQEFLTRALLAHNETQERAIREDLEKFVGWTGAVITARERERAREWFATNGYELVMQIPNGSSFEWYRGIIQNGHWIIDHYPEWPGGPE